MPHCDNNYIILANFYYNTEIAKPDAYDITYCNKV